MKREFAALLAQIIPVAALAVGLEIRALGARYVKLARPSRRRQDRPHTGTRPGRYDAGSGVLLLGAVLFFLAGAEVAVLMQSGYGHGAGGLFFALVTIGIGAAFLAPTFQVLHAVLLLRKPEWAQNDDRRLLVTLGIGATFVALFFLMTGAAWLMV